MKIVVSSFYKYTEIENPEVFQREHQNYCNELGIKGKVLVAREGINGTVSGTKEHIDKYEKHLLNNKLFSGMTYKRTITDEHPFKKTIVRIRKEIVTSGLNVDMKNVGERITPKELKELYDKKEDFIILDARNDYESKIGKFHNAITPKLEVFRDFRKVAKKLSKHKDKKIVMYCTGGIRCEKASAYMKEQGYKKVYHLKDGILNYIEQYPDTYFEGRCFVFDNRLSVPSGDKTEDIALCEFCHIPCGRYINCANMKCDKLFICCNECDNTWEGTCSKSCRGIILNKKMSLITKIKLKFFKFLRIHKIEDP